MTRVRTVHTEPREIDPTRCWCRPTLIGTWRNGQLVSVARFHLPNCGMPVETVDPREFERTAGGRP